MIIIQNIDLAYEDLEFIGSPTEKALLISSASYLKLEETKKKYERKGEIPFDSLRKYMVTRHKLNKSQDIIFIKGAPEKILKYLLVNQLLPDLFGQHLISVFLGR